MIRNPHLAAAALALLLASQAALANGTPTPTPAPPVATSSSTSTSSSSAASVSSSTSSSGAKAASGSHSAVGDVSQGLQVGGDSARAWSLFLPPLAMTPPMAPIQGCAPRVTQRSTGVLVGAFSHAEGSTDPDHCTIIALRNAKVDACQYASAKQLEDLLAAKLLPEFKASQVAQLEDLSPQACAALKAPPRPEPVVNYVAPPPAAATAPPGAAPVLAACQAPPATPARPKPRKAVAVASCVKPLT
jgi:hypothetical protein